MLHQVGVLGCFGSTFPVPDVVLSVVCCVVLVPQAKRTAVHLRWTMLRMAQGDIESGGGVLRDNDVVPLTLACRTVAKAAAKLAMGPETNEAEIKVSQSASQPASLVRSGCHFLVGV